MSRENLGWLMLSEAVKKVCRGTQELNRTWILTTGEAPLLFQGLEGGSADTQWGADKADTQPWVSVKELLRDGDGNG